MGFLLPGPTERAVTWVREWARSEVVAYMDNHGIDFEDVKNQAANGLASKGTGIAILSYIAFGGDSIPSAPRTQETKNSTQKTSVRNNETAKRDSIRNPFT